MDIDEFNKHCSNGNIDKVKEGILDPNIDITYNFNEPFTEAAYQGHLKVIKLLMEPTHNNLPVVNPADYNNYAIKGAIKNNHKEVFEYMINDDIIYLFIKDNLSVVQLMNECIAHCRVDMFKYLGNKFDISYGTDSNYFMMQSYEYENDGFVEMLEKDVDVMITSITQGQSYHTEELINKCIKSLKNSDNDSQKNMYENSKKIKILMTWVEDIQRRRDNDEIT